MDVLSGEISATVDGTGRINNVFAQFCGNGAEDLVRDEECDDGNDDDGDGCDVNCTISACENGISAPGEVCYLPPVAFPAGDGLNTLAAGDFNNDGLLDLATGNADINNNDAIGVLLGNSDSTFQAPQSFVIGGQPSDIATEDFNGDGDLDLVVVKDGIDDDLPEIRIFLGNGNGTFQFNQQVPTNGLNSKSVAVGDFNNDGDLDLVVTNTNSDEVSIFANNGNGFFSPPQTLTALDNPIDVVVEDFDGDGFLDFATTNAVSEDVGVFLGNGNGTFQIPLKFPVEDAGAILAEDFDADGIVDLAVAGVGVSILLGNGDGTFPFPLSFPVEGGNSSLVAGDFNTDGILDLATSRFSLNDELEDVSILFGDGEGFFGSLQNFSIPGGGPSDIVADDFNQDGISDLAATIASADIDNLSILLSAP